MNARHALGLLLRTAHTNESVLPDAQVLIRVVEEMGGNENEMVPVLAVLTRLAGHAVCHMAGIRLGTLDVDSFLAREVAVEAILSRVFDQNEGGQPQG